MYNFVHNFFKNLQILYLKNKRLSVIVSKGNENGVLRKGRSGILRKKSHILLGRYLADQMPVSESLQSHRKAFCLGNILPDIKPSFVTKRHEFFGTFGEVQDKLRCLVTENTDLLRERVFWRRLGEILHYIADYFTFPHNRTFTGSLVEHNSYEKELKNQLKSCIKSGKADCFAVNAIRFTDFDQVIEYIEDRHSDYLKKTRNITDDIRYILEVCFQVFQAVLQFCKGFISVSRPGFAL